MAADRMFSTAVWLIALVAISSAVYLASSVAAPVTFALFLLALIWPVQKRLQCYLPRLLALAIVVLFTIGVFLVFA